MTSKGTEEIVLAHVTDTHVTEDARPSAVLKDRSIEALSDLVRQIEGRGAHCTLFGGDNIDNRGQGERDVEAFLDIAGGLSRYVCIVGNHEADSPRAGRISKEQFARRVVGHGIDPSSYNFAMSIGNVRMIGIDTTLVGSHGGYVSPTTMRFLARELGRATEDHIVVLGHHLLHRTWEPHYLESWDQEYLVANREAVTTLLASNPNVRAYLCGHHHASRIQRIASRGASGGFYHILTSSPVAFPHAARFLRFARDGIHIESFKPRIAGLVDAGRVAVETGRKKKRYSVLGARRSFLQYVQGRSTDNDVFLPYDHAPEADRLREGFERRSIAI